MHKEKKEIKASKNTFAKSPKKGNFIQKPIQSSEILQNFN